jgi:hypothetical protein
MDSSSFELTNSFLWARESVRALVLKNHSHGQLADLGMQFLYSFLSVFANLVALVKSGAIVSSIELSVVAELQTS